jgi:hypothetical protein
MPDPLASPVPLIHESDSFYIYVLHDSPTSVRICYIERFPGNVSVQPTKEQFYDLDPGTRRAVISQVNRRYSGKVVRV